MTQMYSEGKKLNEGNNTDTEEVPEKKSVTWTGIQKKAQTMKLGHSLLQAGIPRMNDFNIKKPIILDMGSMFNLVHDKQLITGMIKVKNPIKMMANVGTRILEQEGTVCGLNEKAEEIC
jgi:hypothetical protein